MRNENPTAEAEVIASWQASGISFEPERADEMRCPSCSTDNDERSKFCRECGAPLAARDRKQPPAPELPASIAAGRYQVKRFLGEGAKKRVYLAHDTRLERDVAVAVLKTDRIDDTSLTRIRLEARAMARLGDHPRIVTVHDIGEDEGTPYIVSQYMAGGTLESLLEVAENRRLSLEQALRIADQICQALEHAHGRGIIHRDLKPANVWLTDDGFAKLGDFGLAMTADRSGLTQEGAMIGTVVYMSPEQALGKTVDARSDLYSLGGLLYELLTGRPPFVGDDAVAIISQHLNAQPVAPSRYNADVPQALDALILRLLAKAPGDRPESAGALREALKGVPAVMPAGSPNADAQAIESLPGGIFVGRKEELEQLRAGLEDAIARRGRLFMLVGEPGIGKTRTAEQLTTYARLRHAQVLVGRCHEGEGAPVYWPWVQILRSYVRERSSLDLASDMGSGAAEIAQIVPEIREKLPDLPQVQSADPESARFRLFDAIATFLKKAAEADPMVVVLDDLHWADKSSLLLLQFLAREMAGSRLLVVGTYRDIEVQRGHALAEVVAAIRRERVYERILLRGLPELEVRALLTALGGQEVPDAFARAIFRETEGNPFFIEEILQHLIEEKVIYREGGRWTTRLRPEEMEIPESVRDVIGRRVGRLSKECSDALTIASVIGRTFGADVLAGVTGVTEERLPELLEEALTARVVNEVPGTRGSYSFSHALIRETLYGELQTGKRLRLHRQIAEVLERLYSRNLDSHLAELSHHFFEAAQTGADVEKAIDYARRAAERADAQLAYAEAVGHYERALQLLEQMDPPDEMRRSEVLLTLGETCWKVFEFDRARDAARQAARLADKLEAPDLLGRAALCLGGYFSLIDFLAPSDEELIAVLNRALELQPPGDSAIRARLIARLTQALFWVETPERQVLLAREAVEMARGVGDPTTIARVLTATHNALLQVDSLDERLAIHVECGAILERSADPTNQLTTQLFNAESLLDAGHIDIPELRRRQELVERLAERTRIRWFQWYVRISRAARAYAEGRIEEAETLNVEGLQLGQECQYPDAPVVFGAEMIRVRREQGRIGEFEALYKATTERLPHIVGYRFTLAFIYAETGRLEEARRAFEEVANTGFSNLRRDGMWFSGLWSLVEICTAIDDERRASELYDLLAPHAQRFVSIISVLNQGSVSRLLGLLATTLQRWEDASRHFEHALREHQRLGLRLWLTWTQYNYANMLLRRDDAGDRSKALLLLSDAVATSQELGLKVLLERSLALKMKLEGTASIDVKTSIDAVAESVEAKKPNLRTHAAPDGTVTIMFSDMEGFSSMTERLGDREAHKVIQTHNGIVRQQVKAHGGYEVELQGDGFLLAFPSASRALQCGIAIQRAFAQYSADHAEQHIRVRIGLHTGEPIKEADRFFGKTVILAARIASEAQGGEIFVSSLVKELTSGASEFVFDSGQETELKGLSGTHDVYELLWDGREPRRKPSSAPPAPSIAGNVFVREGDYWTIAYDGMSVRLRDMKGMHSIAHLLRSPGQEFHVADLATVGEPAAATHVEASSEAPLSAGLGDAGDILDPQARSEYKERLESLREELDEAKRCNDSGRVERLQEEIDFISQELSAAFGLGGRAKKAADSAERIRKTVTGRIRESLGRIQKEHPDLGQHFSRAIRTGTFCSYSPEKPTNWAL